MNGSANKNLASGWPDNGGDAVQDGKSANPEFLRMQQENLLSFVVVSSRDTHADINQIMELSRYVADRFTYYEILTVASVPPDGWVDSMRELGGRIANLRIVVFDLRKCYEELAFSAFSHAIGDYVVSIFPDEITVHELEELLKTLASGQFGVVKSKHTRGATSMMEAMTAKTVGKIIKISTGQDIEANQARAIGVSRGSLSRILTMGDKLKYFRILNVSEQVSQGYVVVSRAPKRRILSAFNEKVRLTIDLVSLSASRLLVSLALTCFVLSIGSIAATILSMFLWLFLTDIVAGWTSLAVLFSSLFAANFGVLGALCLGVLQVIRQNAPNETEIMTSELSGGDLVFQDDRLNVETDGGAGS